MKIYHFFQYYISLLIRCSDYYNIKLNREIIIKSNVFLFKYTSIFYFLNGKFGLIIDQNIFLRLSHGLIS